MTTYIAAGMNAWGKGTTISAALRECKARIPTFVRAGVIEVFQVSPDARVDEFGRVVSRTGAVPQGTRQFKRSAK